MNWSKRTLEKTTAHLHCLLGIAGNYLVTIWIVSSQTLYTLKCIVSSLDEPFSLNVGAMNFLNVSLSHIKNIFGV